MLNPILDPLNDDYFWPYPQLIQTSDYVFLSDRDWMYVLDANWEKTQAFWHNEHGTWDIIDFSSFVLFNNGDQTFHNEDGIWQESDYSLIPKSNCVANFNGQLIFGGVRNTWNGLTENFVVWGNIGQLSAVIGQSLVAGFKDMQIGSILKITTHDGFMLCHGTDGIAELQPVDKAIYFGYKKLHSVGITNKDCATEEFVITKDNILYMISKEGLKELGYEEYLSTLDMVNLRVSKDTLTGDYYICDGIKNFIFSKGMLTQRDKMINGVVELSGVCYSCVNDTTENVEIQLDDMNFNTSGRKQIDRLELIGDYSGNAYGKIKVKYTHGESSFESNEAPFNRDGACYVRGTGNIINPYIRIELPTSMNISAVAFGIKFTDNRIRTQLQMVSGEQE